MKIKIRTKTKRILLIYLGLLLALYLIIYALPKVTDIFETTQILSPGTLTVSCEATGYVIKDEALYRATQTGSIEYLLEEGTVVKKGADLVKITGEGSEAATGEAPVSGVYSLHMDGGEELFNTSNLDKITKDRAEDAHIKDVKLEKKKVEAGDPVFKVSNDDNWYIVCWMDPKDTESYYEGLRVKLELPGDQVSAKVISIKEEDGYSRVVFYLNAYYSDFATIRVADMNIVISNNSGLIVDNECLIEREGVLGVYVLNKNKDYVFKPVKVKATDGKQSAIAESTFPNEKYEQVITVNVYDEVLRNPQSALEKESEDDL